MRFTIAELAEQAARGEKIAMITCYDHASAMLTARAGLRFLLIGDSLGQVMLGHDSTIPVTIDDMVRHAAAVTRGAPDALVVGDLPFLSYATIEQAVASAQALMQQGGVQAVKLEGGAAVTPIVARLVALGVPVMGHIGFTPQAVNQIGVRVQGKSAEAAAQLIRDAEALAAAGAFAIVLELVPAALAEAITQRIDVPTIGIGAGAGCSGQVQVWHDVLGLTGGPVFRHAKRYAEVGAVIEQALKDYAAEVGAGAFPAERNSAKIDPEALAAALASLD